MLDYLMNAPTAPMAFAGGGVFAIVLAGLGGLALARRRNDPRSARKGMRVILRASGLPHVRDVVIPDDVGGYTQLDHLLLTPGGILVLEWQHFTGIVQGSAHALNWSRFEGQRRHDFANPFRRLKALAETLDTLAPGTPVQVRLVVSGPVRFPKGLPEGVLTLAGLREYLAGQHGPIPVEQFERWHRLLSRVACEPVSPLGARFPTPAATPGRATSP